MTTANIGLLAIALFFTAVTTASAQSVPAIDAEVETTYQFQDGRQVMVKGHYYRSSDGKVREDSGSGSLITDVRARTITMLNTERRQAIVLEMPEPVPHQRRPVSPPVPFGRGTHEGRVVEKTQVTSADGSRQELWLATELGAVVYSRIDARGLTTIKTLQNVRTEEPAPVLFEVPSGYEVARQALPPEPNETLPKPAPRRTPGR